MKCKKLSKREIASWEKVMNVEYEDSPLSEVLSFDEFSLIVTICSCAAHDEFEHMHAYIQAYSVEMAQDMDNPTFESLLKRAYEHAVASGDAGSCCNLANMYHNTTGKGSAEDYAYAIELYELGASRGEAQSAVNLGYIYYYGRGVEKDYVRAYECWSRVALLEDHPEAYWKLGDLYAGGKGVPKSDWMAWRLYSKAHEAANGDAFGCRAAHHMADYLLKGIKGQLDPNPDRALRLYNEAEVGYYALIDQGLTYYQRQLDQAIEGQRAARVAAQLKHQRIRDGFADGDWAVF